ncbi:ribosome biogenesis GTP-binding protein YihA/YsxC [bacterium]|nr:ribosome biogenesis GTP-binding protein YihA/YsxC [bacterium]MCI0605048.1 ribosome biogenesis GTP-binding protein YihA/YsxC [bacterium]
MSAVFLGSFVAPNTLPEQRQPRVAILGRSNVGKSSLINLLAGTKIAKVSKTPGKTQTLNLYVVKDRWVFGDFPGYGFAKVSKVQRKTFQRLVDHFLNEDHFQYAIQIVDSRHPAMSTDMELHEWLKSSGVKHLIVLNKSDKLNQKERNATQKQAAISFPGAAIIFASNITNEGKREIEITLDQLKS